MPELIFPCIFSGCRFVFGMLLDDFVATDDEQLLSLYIIDSWTNFAKTGWVTVSTLFEKIDMLS